MPLLIDQQGAQYMGASEWSYFVPFQHNIQQAFHELQAAEFQQGNYGVRQAFNAGNMSFEDFLPPDPDMTDEEREAWRYQFETWQAEVQSDSFETLEALREWNGPDGLHSILDMRAVIGTPLSVGPVDGWSSYDSSRIGLIWPLTSDQLMQLFGTTRPTRALVEATHNQYHTFRERWQGLYIIVYDGDQPSEIFFTGYSGD